MSSPQTGGAQTLHRPVPHCQPLSLVTVPHPSQVLGYLQIDLTHSHLAQCGGRGADLHDTLPDIWHIGRDVELGTRIKVSF